MRRLHVLAASVSAALLIAAAVFGAIHSGANADDRRYLRCAPLAGDNCPPPPLMPYQSQLLDSGVWAWTFQSDPGVPDVKPAILEAHAEYARDVGIQFVEVSGGNVEFARSSIAFYYGDGVTLGCPGAVGCLAKYPSSEVWYDAQVMGNYYFESQQSVSEHEDCHAIADCGEYYIHCDKSKSGCPYTGIFCNADPTTVMSCGIGHALRLSAFDKETIRRYLFPLLRTGGSYDAQTGILWYGRSDDRTRRIAIWLETYSGYRFWLGVYATPVCQGSNAYVCNGVALPLLGKCVRVLRGDENAIGGSWGQGLVDVGGTSCF